jgi:hypothetical protein
MFKLIIQLNKVLLEELTIPSLIKLREKVS